MPSLQSRATADCEESQWTIHPIDPSQVNWIGRAIKPLRRADFLGRSSMSGRHWTWVANVGGRIAGLVSADPWAFLVFRDARSLEERLEVDAEVHYPVLPTHRPELAEALLSVALRELEISGCGHAYLALPLDSHGPRDVADRLGFTRVGIRSDPASKLLYAKTLAPASTRRALFGFARGAAVRSTASAADAPRPDGSFWVQAPVYSGFSAYPHLGGLLDLVVPEGCRSFLSVPCATGDALRWLGRRGIDRAAGIDINPVALEFARSRLAVPALDEVNLVLSESFLADLRGEPNDLDGLINGVVNALNPGHAAVDGDDLEQLRSAWKFGSGASDAVSDHWLPMKGLVELAGRPEGVHPLSALARAAVLPNTAAALGRLAEARGRGILPEVPARSTSFIQADLLAEKTSSDVEQYDCIFCFEAMLMFFAAGRQDEFLNTLLGRLGRNGRLVVTGIHDGVRLPRELRWAARELDARGMDVRVGRYLPDAVAWAPLSSVRPFPFITADRR